MKVRGAIVALTLGVLGVLALGGCTTADYLRQSVVGHLDILRRTRSVTDWLAEPNLDGALRERLELARRVRNWAVAELGLPDNASYRRYAELDRPAAVWNVVAAPELSLTLKTWCFPVLGCVGYRGYYAREEAEALAASLRAEGLEASVYGVPAYSTLGWLEWLGGDPLLSTFIGWPDGELARLIFHELAHQVAYASDDTVFNESFATAVEQAGLERWLAAREAANRDPALRSEWQRFAERREQFLALLKRYRGALEAAYASPVSDDDKRASRREIFASLRRDYEALKQQWGGYAGYDRWFAQPLTNAHLASVATYTEQVPAFRALLAQEGDDLPAFYAAARRLGELPKADRERALAALAPQVPRMSQAGQTPKAGQTPQAAQVQPPASLPAAPPATPALTLLSPKSGR